MTETKTEKLVIIVTTGPENAEKASIPFVMAVAALALDIETTVVLQANGVLLGTKTCYGHVHAAELPPLEKLLDDFLELGGRLLVCVPCLEERKIGDDLLLPGVEKGKAAKVVMVTLEADSTMSY